MVWRPEPRLYISTLDLGMSLECMNMALMVSVLRLRVLCRDDGWLASVINTM